MQSRHTTKLSLLAVVCLVLLSCMPLRAQTSQKSAESVYLESVKAIKDSGLSQTARFMHPDELTRFRDSFWPAIQAGFGSNGPAKDFVKLFGFVDSLPGQSDVNANEFFTNFVAFITTAMPNLESTLRSMESKVVGSVPDGDSLVFLVTRNTVSYQGDDVVSVELVTMKSYKDTWLLAINPELEGLMESLKSRMLSEGR